METNQDARNCRNYLVTATFEFQPDEFTADELETLVRVFSVPADDLSSFCRTVDIVAGEIISIAETALLPIPPHEVKELADIFCRYLDDADEREIIRINIKDADVPYIRRLFEEAGTDSLEYYFPDYEEHLEEVLSSISS